MMCQECQKDKSMFASLNIEIKEYKDYKEEEILRLYTEVGETAYTENMAALR